MSAKQPGTTIHPVDPKIAAGNGKNNGSCCDVEAQRKPAVRGISIHRLLDTMTHRLSGTGKGESEVEILARDIEERRANRIPVPFRIRLSILNTCKGIAKERGYEDRSAILVSDLRDLHEKLKNKVEDGLSNTTLSRLAEGCRFRNKHKVALRCLDKAVEVVDKLRMRDEEKWHYRDFLFYFTEHEAYWPWMRYPLSRAFFWTFLFYLSTPILFCLIYRDEGICPSSQNYGWMSSLYFASTTMSTVGYGDLSVTKDKRWKVFLGICYMIVGLLVAILSFSAILGTSFSAYNGFWERTMLEIAHFFSKVLGLRKKKDMLLHERIRLAKWLKIGAVVAQFTILNLIGVFASRFFVRASTDPNEQWTWMESLYWAVQTTTTIGYGDLAMSYSMRWFQIFYLVLGTYFVGDTLGKLSDLQSELLQLRRQYAWERRETDRAMVEDMQGGDGDERVDQYEFVVASLLQLQKIDSSDIKPIMDKFRELVDETGFIQISDVQRHDMDHNEAYATELLDASGNIAHNPFSLGEESMLVD